MNDNGYHYFIPAKGVIEFGFGPGIDRPHAVHVSIGPHTLRAEFGLMPITCHAEYAHAEDPVGELSTRAKNLFR